MSISRRDGCQSASVAPRYDAYLPAVSANEAGIGGTPSTTKFSPGAITGSCAKPHADKNAIAAKTRIDLLTMDNPLPYFEFEGTHLLAQDKFLRDLPHLLTPETIGHATCLRSRSGTTCVLKFLRIPETACSRKSSSPTAAKSPCASFGLAGNSASDRQLSLARSIANLFMSASPTKPTPSARRQPAKAISTSPKSWLWRAAPVATPSIPATASSPKTPRCLALVPKPGSLSSAPPQRPWKPLAQKQPGASLPGALTSPRFPAPTIPSRSPTKRTLLRSRWAFPSC